MKYKETILKANNFVLENLFDDIYLEDVAKACAYSPFHFHKIYKEATGLNIGKFTRIMKLKHSLYLLVEKKYNVTKTSQEVGFYTPSSFSVAFKDRYSFSPVSIKKILDKNTDKEFKEVCCTGNDCEILTMYYERMDLEELKSLYKNLSIIYDNINNPKILEELSLIYSVLHRTNL